MIKKIVLITFLLTLSNTSICQNFWERIPSPTDKFLRTLHFADSLRGWVAGDSGLIFYTSDGGISWVQQESNTTHQIMRIFFLDDKNGWGLTWVYDPFFGTEILKTTDGGANWSIEQYKEEFVFLRGIYFLDTLKGFSGGMPAQFLQTIDGGINWERAHIDSGTFSQFPVINFRFYNDLYGFAVGGRFDIAGVIWRTINGGENWVAIDPQYAPPDEVWDIHFFDSLHVMAVGGDPDFFGVALMHSTDAGLTWDYYEIGVHGQALSISFRTENEGWAVVPLSERMVATYDYGVTWTDYIAPDSSKLYEIVFTDSLTGYAVGEDGVIVKYKYQPPDNVYENSTTVIKDFVLYQNYPNPFNPTTTIRYNLSEPGQVSVNIYNVLGNHIATLVQDYKSSGEHSLVWNAENEPSGVYYFQLNMNGKLATRKMVLLK
ncbi:MAG: YCF48-related protein [Ignavibacteriaceae bacterium]|nr:YCF48-related protein [Ignavibacteriaceae bacterium]